MLAELLSRLREDDELAGLLAQAEWGAPAVFVDWSPDHARPYITLSIDESLPEQNVTEGDVTFDIWGDGTSAVALEPIRDRLQELLDHAIVDSYRGPVRFFYASDGPERDEDPSIVRWRAVYGFRRGRTEHVS